MQKHILFIADLHLSNAAATTAKLFFDFLTHRAPQAEALYILGDLFKLWIGDDDNSEFNQQVKAALKQLSQQIPIYLMPGNRDFLLGSKFAQESGVKLLLDPCVINLYGTPTLLTHGDALCSNDLVHKIFRCITRPIINQKIFLQLPFKFRSYLANKIQQFSANRKPENIEYAKITPQTTIEKTMLQFNVQQLIFGHIHHAAMQNFNLVSKNARFIVLGDWNAVGSFLILNADGTAELQTWHNQNK